MLLRQISLISCLILASLNLNATAKTQQLTAAVASPDQYGAQVAAEILRQGGNAVMQLLPQPIPWQSPIRRQVTWAAVAF